MKSPAEKSLFVLTARILKYKLNQIVSKPATNFYSTASKTDLAPDISQYSEGLLPRQPCPTP